MGREDTSRHLKLRHLLLQICSALKHKGLISQTDAPSKFFLSLEKKNGHRVVIFTPCALKMGKDLRKTSDIRKRAVQFYEKLYSSEYRKDEELSAGFYQGLGELKGRAGEACF